MSMDHVFEDNRCDGHCRVSTSAFRARACAAGGHEHGQNEPRKLDM